MPETIDQRVEALLACPRCRTSPLAVTEAGVECTACSWSAVRRGTILTAASSLIDSSVPSVQHASFDEKYHMVDHHNHHPVVWDLCYRRQCAEIETTLGSKLAQAATEEAVLLDVGCGPGRPYSVPESGLIAVGVDPSLASLAVNQLLDLGLHGGADCLPLTDCSVDVVVAIYALHHMIGRSVADSWANVVAVFSEIARVSKPGAHVMVMEICPWKYVWPIERAMWAPARRIVGDRIDFLFWPRKTLIEAGSEAFPGSVLDVQTFDVSPLAIFPPIIGMPRIKTTRFAYPLTVCLFQWQLPD